MKNLRLKSLPAALLAVGLSMAAPVFAQETGGGTVDPIDVSLALAGVAALKTAITAIVGALITYYSGMFALTKVMSFVKRKSGTS